MQIATVATGREHHDLPAHEVVLLLGTDEHRGLSAREARRRLAQVGPNQLPPPRRRGPAARFLQQLSHPLVLVLLGSAAVTLALGDTVDSAVILGVVLVNAVVGFVQESRAEQALAALVALASASATVVRDGRAVRVPSTEVVPGDVVLLEAGDKVPADLRLTAVADLAVDESSLTGESAPVAKEALVLPPHTPLADRLNMAYSTTLVTLGQGRAIAVGTGPDTEIGRIHRLVGDATGVATPLTRKLARFSGVLTAVILLLAALTFVLGVVRGESAAEMVTAAVALAVGAIPEGLPAAVTITLAIGVARMARRNAIVRRLPAAETLGSTTVICTDKTGTLTENRMTVRAVVAGGRRYDVTGGSSPADGEVRRDGLRVRLVDEPALATCLTGGVLCNDARLPEVDEDGPPLGDPTEAALLVASAKGGLDPLDVRATWPRTEVLPFSSERRLMVTGHRGPQGRHLVVVKGAVDQVLPCCDCALDADGRPGPLDLPTVLATADDLAGSALRLLAVAVGEPEDDVALDDVLARGRLALVGMQGMADPPRPEAIRAVEACGRAGIDVKMVTGDHERTARAVARQVGLGGTGPLQVLTGADLATCPDRDLPEAAAASTVFARVSPEQKLRLVEALQARGEVVAMTGDGVNDAPALRQADIGVAMGSAGTEVAKEAADIVLTDDDFASIEAAVEEGRGVFDNLTKFIVWTLPTNLGEGMVILAAILTGALLPILPVQILWINMTTAVALGLMLAFEPREPGTMQRPPRDPAQPLLTRALVGRIALVSTLLLVGAFGLFGWQRATGQPLDEARTVAVNVFVMVEIFYLFNCRSLERSSLQVGLWSNRPLLLGVAVTILLQGALTYLPAMNRAFGTAPVPLSAWGPILAVGLAAFGVVGAEKSLRRRLGDRPQAR